MTTTPATPEPLFEVVFGSFWRERDLAGSPRLLLAALGAGLLAAVVVPYRELGIGTFLVFVAVAIVVSSADVRRRRHAPALVLALALGSMVFVRDAQWIVVLCVLASLAVGAATLVPVRSFTSLVVAGIAVPLAGLRGLPWLGRSIVAGRAGALSWAVIRTVVLSALLVLVFGGLFASADALFAAWAGTVVPDLSPESVVLRGFVTVSVAGATLAFSYVALNPPAVSGLAIAAPPVRRTFEWLAPVLLVIAVFAMFVVAQLAVMFGGHDYLRRTTGVTYADYVHQGFGQMCVATVLTLAVVAVAAHRAPRSRSRDRLLLRSCLGSLCALALVVVASALYRMHVYEDAFGFTRLRLLVSVFEGWLGLLLVLVLLAGIRLRGAWLPLAGVVTGAAALLGLALLNPDGYIATHNLDRFERTGKIDLGYLSGLSADASSALEGSPVELPCPTGDDWLEWNLGRARC